MTQDEADIKKLPWVTVLQVAALLAPAASVYAVMVSKDAEMQVQLVNIKEEVKRQDAVSKDLRHEIKGDLKDIMEEVRNLRADINNQRKK